MSVLSVLDLRAHAKLCGSPFGSRIPFGIDIHNGCVLNTLSAAVYYKDNGTGEFKLGKESSEEVDVPWVGAECPEGSGLGHRSPADKAFLGRQMDWSRPHLGRVITEHRLKTGVWNTCGC